LKALVFAVALLIDAAPHIDAIVRDKGAVRVRHTLHVLVLTALVMIAGVGNRSATLLRTTSSIPIAIALAPTSARAFRAGPVSAPLHISPVVVTAGTQSGEVSFPEVDLTAKEVGETADVATSGDQVMACIFKPITVGCEVRLVAPHWTVIAELVAHA